VEPEHRTARQLGGLDIIQSSLLTANAEVTSVLGSIPASSDKVKICGAADEAVVNKVVKK
jgi:hypothetical protein